MSKKPGFLQRFRAGRVEADEKDGAQQVHPADAEPPGVIGRRGSRRVAAPIGLYYMVPPDRFVTLDLRLEINEDDGRRSIPCFLFDVNETGMAFACEERLEPDSTAHIVGHLGQDMAPLVECDVQIVDARPFPESRPCPPDFDRSALQVHGGTLALRDAMGLLRATLDCVAHQLRQDRGRADIDAEDEGIGAGHDDDSGPAPEPWRKSSSSGTEVSFATLPVASVEIIDAELRRHVDRIGMSMPLAYVAKDNRCHRVNLHVGRPEQGMETAAIGKLVDYSTDGACIETKRRYEVGDQVRIFGTSVDTGSVLFEDSFQIKNRRTVSGKKKKGGKTKEFTFGATVDGSLEEQVDSMYAYGLQHTANHTNLLYKAVMDSVLLSKLNEERDEPLQSLDDV